MGNGFSQRREGSRHGPGAEKDSCVLGDCILELWVGKERVTGDFEFCRNVLAWQPELSCYTDKGGLELIACELQGPWGAERAVSPEPGLSGISSVNVAGSPPGLSTNPNRFPFLS